MSCASQALKPEDCLVRCCITALAPCTNSLRRYWFPPCGIFHNVCLPPVECSSGTTPNQAAKSRPLRNAVPLPMVAMIAVAVTGPTPGIFNSLRSPEQSSQPTCQHDRSSRLAAPALASVLQAIPALPPTAWPCHLRGCRAARHPRNAGLGAASCHAPAIAHEFGCPPPFFASPSVHGPDA